MTIVNPIGSVTPCGPAPAASTPSKPAPACSSTAAAGCTATTSPARFTTTGTSISDGATLLASTGWEAAVAALHAGELPASSGERKMLLLAASIAGGTPVSLNDTLPGIDRRNASLVVSAVAHAAGLPAPYQETDKRHLSG